MAEFTGLSNHAISTWRMDLYHAEKILEINESKFGKRKYSGGRLKDGIIERNSD